MTQLNCASLINRCNVCYLSRCLTLLLVVTLLSACAATRQGRSVENAGFLSNYSQLQEKGGDEALKVYINPDVDCRQYRQVYIEPVQIWAKGKNSDLGKLPANEKQMLVNLAMSAVAKGVRSPYRIAQQPGPGVMTMRAAITEAEESWVVLDTISSIVPQMRAVSEITGLLTGKPSFTGLVAAEIEVLDSQTHERLFAAVDKRIGGKALSGVTNSWDDVKQAFDYWGDKVSKRMNQCSTKGTFAF